MGGNFGQYGASYCIRSAFVDKVLNVDTKAHKHTDLTTYSFTGNKNQRFTINNDGDDLIIRNIEDNRVLEVSHNSDGIRLVPYNGSPSQRWTLRRVDDGQNKGFYFILNASNGNCLDISQQKMKDFADIISYKWNGGSNQMWEIIPCSRGMQSLPPHPKFNNNFGQNQGFNKW